MTWTVEQHTSRYGNRYYTATEAETGRSVDLWSPTTILNCLAKPNIERWKLGKVARGIAANDDLRMLALSGDDEAKEAAQQALERERSAANHGTARHKVSEQVTTAADAFEIAAELRPWATRYGQLLDDHGIVIRQTEIVVVNLTHGYAGTADRFVVHDGHRRLADVKTGSAGYFDNALQLAAYANAEYAYIDGDLVPLPDDMDRETGLILHVPAEGDRADVLSLPLGEAWEAFKAACVIKRAQEANKGTIGETLPPTHRFTSLYVDWLRARLAEHHAQRPHLVAEFQAWRAHRFPGRGSMSFSTDELEECLTALCQIEATHAVPFADDYPHPHGPRLTDDQAEVLRTRIDTLPRWAQAKVAEARKQLPSIDRWRTVDAETFEAQTLAPLESEAASILTAVLDLRSQAGDACTALALAFTAEPMTEWGWDEFNVFGALVEAYLDGLLLVDGDQVVIVPTVVDRLIDKHGSKSDVTKRIRARVDELGITKAVPRALSECAQDPILVALAAA